MGRSWLGVGLSLGVLNLPKLGAGATVIGELRAKGAWPIDFGLTYFFDNDASLDRDEIDLRAHPLIGLPYPAGGSRLRFNSVQVSAAACPYERNLKPGVLLLCLGAQGGVLHVRGEGFAAATTAVASSTHPELALVAYARWHFRISDTLGVSYSAGLFVPFMRDRFGYLDRYGAFTQKFREGVLGGRLDLVLTYGF